MKNIVIIGRPNVGKSTLFNRLVGKRRAITDPTPGVTRDPISEKWILGMHTVNLTDSGGVKLDLSGLDDLVAQKSLSLLDGADAIIFMMDCTEVTPEDQMLVQKLRPYSDKVVLAVNKIDDVTREDLLWNYFSYGYQRVVGISSAHGLGIDGLEETISGMLNLDDEERETEDSEEVYETAQAGAETTEVASTKESKPKEPEPETSDYEKKSIKLAVLGKPNTGKSTLANLLTGEDLSIVSPIAGTTRDVVKGGFFYKHRDFEILDTAGIRRKAKVEEDVEYYSVNRAIKTIDEADVVLLIVDAVEGLAEQDKKIANLIVRRGKGVVLVLNKIDLLSGTANELVALEDRVRFLFPILNFAPVEFISAQRAKNIDKMLDTVLKIYAQLNKRIDTAALNNALSNWSDSYQPPRGSEGHFKVYYGTQISANPVKFLFFVNRKKDFPQPYIQYLKNCIRRDLGFLQIPVEIDLRERERSVSNHKLGQSSKVRSLKIDVSEQDGNASKQNKNSQIGVKKSTATKPAVKPAAAKSVATKSSGREHGLRNVQTNLVSKSATTKSSGRAKAKPAAKKVGAHAKAKALAKFREQKKRK